MRCDFLLYRPTLSSGLRGTASRLRLVQRILSARYDLLPSSLNVCAFAYASAFFPSLLLQYLRIKRAVQAAMNTESSYLSAKLAQVQAGGAAADEAVHGGVEVDPMAALDAATGQGGGIKGAFVPATQGAKIQGTEKVDESNKDEITMDDDDDDDDEE